MASQQQSGRAAARARRQLQVSGKGAANTAATAQPTRQPNSKPSASASAPAAPASSYVAPARPGSSTKSASRQRRASLAARGKTAERSGDRQRSSEMAMRNRNAATAKAIKDGKCGCGGDCCKEADAKAAASAPVSTPMTASPAPARVSRKRPVVDNTGRMLSRARRAAMAGRGKAGLEAHSKGNSSASLARQANPDISARDLARVVRESRSKNGARGSASAAPARARRPRNAAEAKMISGTNVGHTDKMTGDESGLCHSGITGTSYMSSEVFDKFCKTDAAPKAPAKVETTSTMRGAVVTSGGKVGGSSMMTGNEAGGCRDVTGSEYLGSEHFAKMCDTTPKGSPAKVSQSQTTRGQIISGPRSNRAENVTGNMKGTCKAVSGTPYTGMEEFASFCAPEDQRKVEMRTVMPKRAPGAGKDITGIQPGIEGKSMTGAETGACQPVSGTPYIGASQLGNACAAVPAATTAPDFPQKISEGQFSVLPSVADNATITANSVTGTGYENEGAITGAFSMGKGKVTGTEQSRFGTRSDNVVTVEAKPAEVAQASRVTGEGIETGLRITGDDWDRGDRVTGTEGSSAARRNPSRSGAMSAMPSVAAKREPQVVRESANVTGGSGGYQGTASITVSGGARG